MPSVFFESLKKIVSYAVPISVAQLVRILTPIVSTVMIAHLGILPLAASSLVGSYYLVSMLFGFGMVFSVTIQASQHIGAKDYAAATRSVVNGIWLAGGIGLIALLLYILGPVILILFGQDPKIVALTPYYFYLLAISIAPYLVMFTLQQLLIAMGKPRLLFRLSILTTVVALSTNYIFVFGVGRWHGIGLAGLGVGFLLSTIIVFIATLACLVNSRERYPILKNLLKVDIGGVKSLFHLGWPIGLNMVVEVGAMTVLVLMIGWINHFGLAAYPIIWQISIFYIMIPFGVRQSSTALVGQLLGAKEFKKVRALSFTAIGLCVTIMLILAILYVIFNHSIIGWFLRPNMDHEQLVAGIAYKMLYITAGYQIFDAVRIVSVGCLRGLRDVHVPLVLSFIGYWLIGIPVAALFGFGWGLGAVGMWLGLAASVVFCAVVIFVRLVKRLQVENC